MSQEIAKMIRRAKKPTRTRSKSDLYSRRDLGRMTLRDLKQIARDLWVFNVGSYRSNDQKKALIDEIMTIQNQKKGKKASAGSIRRLSLKDLKEMARDLGIHRQVSLSSFKSRNKEELVNLIINERGSSRVSSPVRRRASPPPSESIHYLAPELFGAQQPEEDVIELDISGSDSEVVQPPPEFIIQEEKTHPMLTFQERIVVPPSVQFLIASAQREVFTLPRVPALEYKQQEQELAPIIEDLSEKTNVDEVKAIVESRLQNGEDYMKIRNDLKIVQKAYDDLNRGQMLAHIENKLFSLGVPETKKAEILAWFDIWLPSHPTRTQETPNEFVQFYLSSKLQKRSVFANASRSLQQLAVSIVAQIGPALTLRVLRQLESIQKDIPDLTDEERENIRAAIEQLNADSLKIPHKIDAWPLCERMENVNSWLKNNSPSTVAGGEFSFFFGRLFGLFQDSFENVSRTSLFTIGLYDIMNALYLSRGYHPKLLEESEEEPEESEEEYVREQPLDIF